MFNVKLEKLLKWANTTYENEESGLRRHYKEGYRNAVNDIIHMYEAYKVQSSASRANQE